MRDPIDRTSLLRALQARLHLDMGLGVPYARVSCTSLAILSKQTTARAAMPPAATSPLNRAAPQGRVSSLHASSVGATAVAADVSTTPSAAVCLPPDYVSLVPFQPSPTNTAKQALLADRKAACLTCMACPLSERRTHVAWGEGSLDAEVMFIGEGPGRDEDREGRPFVGRSGRVLTDIIEKGMKVPRSHVYITNVVKCRPPGNRDPKPEEVAACSRYLQRQIEVISPKILVAVGGVAGCALLGLPPKTSGLRGKWHTYQEIPMRVIYHPSYLLRQRRHDDDRTDADRTTWADIQEVLRKLGDV